MLVSTSEAFKEDIQSRGWEIRVGEIRRNGLIILKTGIILTEGVRVAIRSFFIDKA